jgi:hypothetical protein
MSIVPKLNDVELATDREKQAGRIDWNPEHTYKLMTILHHVLVMIDDWICEIGQFSRKAKGKYLDGRDGR